MRIVLGGAGGGRKKIYIRDSIALSTRASQSPGLYGARALKDIAVGPIGLRTWTREGAMAADWVRANIVVVGEVFFCPSARVQGKGRWKSSEGLLVTGVSVVVCGDERRKMTSNGLSFTGHDAVHCGRSTKMGRHSSSLKAGPSRPPPRPKGNGKTLQYKKSLLTREQPMARETPSLALHAERRVGRDPPLSQIFASLTRPGARRKK